ncbi:MAG: hypothetical protein K0R34_783 [Herbinix sp.]|jgi:hypothetical protein|nr:hypothetical protein [Herbinix sp.]
MNNVLYAYKVNKLQQKRHGQISLSVSNSMRLLYYANTTFTACKPRAPFVMSKVTF